MSQPTKYVADTGAPVTDADVVPVGEYAQIVSIAIRGPADTGVSLRKGADASPGDPFTGLVCGAGQDGTIVFPSDARPESEDGFHIEVIGALLHYDIHYL